MEQKNVGIVRVKVLFFTDFRKKMLNRIFVLNCLSHLSVWEHQIRHGHAFSKSRSVNGGGSADVVQKKDQVFHGYITREIIFGHGATPKAAQSTIKTTATLVPCGLDFFAPVVGLGV